MLKKIQQIIWITPLKKQCYFVINIYKYQGPYHCPAGLLRRLLDETFNH